MSSDTQVQWNNQAGRDNIITQTQTIIYNGSIWILLSISILLILWWIESGKKKLAKRLKFLEEQFRPHIIENASYDDQAKRCCDPGTRKDVLRRIISWIDDISEKSKCFYWLYGGPGVGKSTIAASTAKHCLDRHILGAQFFINRDDMMTTDPRILFPTISYQLCQRFPHTVAVVVEKIIRDQPSLLNDISKEQATKLFVKAIDAAATTDRSRAVVIVTDALDETDPKHLWDLAQILSTVVADLPRNAKVLITSRGENAIVRAFQPLHDCKRVEFESLATTKSIEEVSRFMKKKVGQILEEYGIDWAEWGDDRMEKFSSKASGLYIWAETALKYLRAAIHNSGITCFKRVLDMLTDNAMDGINNLYLKILRETCKPGDWEYQRFRRIVGAILVRQTALSIAAIGQLLNLQDPNYSDTVDLVHFVRQYRTVLVDDTQEIDDSVVPRLHKSFADFITSERAQEFRVVVSTSHGELALQCINQLNNLNAYLLGTTERPLFPTQVVYASQYWKSHLTRMFEPIIKNDDEENEGIPKDDTQSLPADPDGVKDPKPDTEEIKRQGLSSLGFSPDGTQIVSPFLNDIHIRDARTCSVILSLVGHEDSVWDIGFSPNGTQIVSGSRDRTARIWDTRTGRMLHVLRGHTDGVWHAAFSHDGRAVVACSLDKTLCTWDSSTSQLLNVFKGHEEPVYYCEFSPNDQRIASSSGLEIIVWDVNLGNLISKIKYECPLILFCSCGDHLISCNAGAVKLWDPESGKQLGHANPTVVQLFIGSEQSASNLIHALPVLEQSRNSDSNTPHLYTLQVLTNYAGIFQGIVEHDHPEGIWILLSTSKTNRGMMGLRLYVAAGATVMQSKIYDNEGDNKDKESVAK